MSTKIDVLQDQLAAGVKADLMLKAFGDLHAQREKQTLDELLAWFLSQPWDERTAIRYIAKLSENRAQWQELEHRSRKGAQARETLLGGKTTAD